MLSTGLPVSRYVTVAVTLTTPAITAQAINTCLIVTSDTFIDPGERARFYDSISGVARDAGTDSVVYGAADIYFSQNPRPDHLLVGRWIRDPSPGNLLCAILSATEQDIMTWRAITDGSFAVPVNGVMQTVSGLDFSGQTNLNGVATVISTALTDASARWTGQRFVFATTATGVGSTIGFLTPTGSGTDISDKLRGGATTHDRVVDGQAPESALSAVANIDAQFSSNFYAVVVPEADDNDHQQIAAYVEAADPVHYYGVTTMDSNVLDPVNETDIGSLLDAYGYNKTACQYSSSTPYAVLSYLGRILTTQWGGTNTVPTLMYKIQPGVQIELLATYQADALQDKHVNVYTGVANGAHITQYGTSSSGEWTDVIIGADALALDIQSALFYMLYNTPTKIPQTDFGMNLLTNSASAVCSRYVQNGYLAPGVWNAPGFGLIEQGDLLPQGYYVWAPSIATQDPNERAQRKSPLIQIMARVAGAIHTVDVAIYINQ